MATSTLRAFPDPDTIRGLARGLGMSQTDIVLASARSLGLDVRDDGPAGALVINDVSELDEESRFLLNAMARQLVTLSRERRAADVTVGIFKERDRNKRRLLMQELGQLSPEILRSLKVAMDRSIADMRRRGDKHLDFDDVARHLAEEADDGEMTITDQASADEAQAEDVEATTRQAGRVRPGGQDRKSRDA